MSLVKIASWTTFGRIIITKIFSFWNTILFNLWISFFTLTSIWFFYVFRVWFICTFITEITNLCSITDALKTNFTKSRPTMTFIIHPNCVAYDLAFFWICVLTTRTYIKWSLRTCTPIFCKPFLIVRTLNTLIITVNCSRRANTLNI